MKQLLLSFFVLCSLFLFNACESCVQKTSKKITELSLSAIESASDVIAEHGETTGEKAVGALGSVAKGVGKGLENFIIDLESENKLGPDRTIIESTDEFNITDTDSLFKEINHSAILPDNVSLEYLGEFNEIPAIAAIFTFDKPANYIANFQFLDRNNKMVYEKKVNIHPEDINARYTQVGLMMNSSEKRQYDTSRKAKVTVTEK